MAMQIDEGVHERSLLILLEKNECAAEDPDEGRHGEGSPAERLRDPLPFGGRAREATCNSCIPGVNPQGGPTPTRETIQQYRA